MAWARSGATMYQKAYKVLGASDSNCDRPCTGFTEYIVEKNKRGPENC